MASAVQSRRGFLARTACFAALLPAIGCATAPPPAGSPTPVVATSNGPIRGRMLEGGVYAFKGVRYGAPPTGALRFRPPQKPAPWTAVADAANFGDAAVQSADQPDMPAYETHSEDCLFLNVWTPGLDRARRPVMVWLHGGGFSGGSPNRPTYQGHHFAADGVVLVGVTHRLNVFGYTQLPDSWGPEYRSSGLAGMLDIVLALEWVRDNAEAFGGDPNNVTIFGESGGGAKVSLLLGMPPANGLFHKAIIQSGAGLDAGQRAPAQALGAALMQELGVAEGDVSALAAIDTQRIYNAQQGAAARVRDSAPQDGFLTVGFVPSIDGAALPRGPFTPNAPAMSAHIPIMVGTNKDEGTLFAGFGPNAASRTDADFEQAVRAAYPERAAEIIPAMRAAYPGYSPSDLIAQIATARMFWLNSVALAERKLAQNAAPVYMYMMTWETTANGGALRSTHALELSFVFGTHADGDPGIANFVGPGDGPARMGEQMQPAWVAFAYTGNPNHAAIPHWPPYNTAQRPTMIFDLESRVANDPYGQLRRLMWPFA